MIGKTISHFRIVEKLGGGAMGVVYLADDLDADRKVALRFLPPHLGADGEANARFVREAKAASALNHPNVCMIYEIGRTGTADMAAGDAQQFIAMAHYEGQTLEAKLNAGAIPSKTALDIARQIALGLSVAHENDIIHGGVTPASIFVTNQGPAVILDFGMARLAQARELGETAWSMGAAHYVSPEMLRGEPIDHRSDVWSLGVLLYEMLAGERPFDGDRHAVRRAILNTDPPALAGQSAFIEGIVRSCLHKNPRERTASAETLTDRLGKLSEV